MMVYYIIQPMISGFGIPTDRMLEVILHNQDMRT